MRWPVVFLLVLVAVLQYPLWLGRGGWLRVWELEKTLQAQHAHGQSLEQRNARLNAEVSDLRSGTDAIEERARYDLGLVKPGEIFVQIVPQKSTGAGQDPPTPAPANVPVLVPEEDGPVPIISVNEHAGAHTP